MTEETLGEMHSEIPGRVKTADGLIAVDRQQRITGWNEAAEEMFGRKAEDVLGKKCYEVMRGVGTAGPNTCKRSCSVISNAVRGRASRDFDMVGNDADGRQRWINVSLLISAPFGKDGRITHLFRDVTERRSVEGWGGPGREQADGCGQAAPAPARLTRREDQVLRLLASGSSTAQIAEALGVKPVSARNHITRLLNKLGAPTRLQAVIIASRSGLL